MRRLAPLALALTLSALSAAPAVAAWRELPTYDLPGDAAAHCLRPAGPGVLTVGAGRTVERLTIGADALTAAPATALGRSTLCPEPADGAARLLAGPVVTEGRGRRARWQMAVSADDGPPTLLARRPVRYIGPPAVAVAPAGAAVVAWVERGSIGSRRGAVVAAVRPAANAPFGAPQELGVSDAFTPLAGVDDTGRAHVAWMRGRSLRRADTLLASAAPGQPFARSRRLARAVADSAAALAVAPNGRALLVAPTDNAVELWELAPGASGFTRGQRVAFGGEQLSLALRADGAAALAVHEPYGEGVALLRRDGSGRFGRAEAVLTPAGADDRLDQLGYSSAEVYSVAGGGQLADHRRAQVAVALGERDELVVSWFDPPRENLPAIPYAWHGTLASRAPGRLDGYRIAGRGTRLGSPCRTAGTISPVTLADGRLAVAWSDDGRTAGDSLSEYGIGAGRVHVAVPVGSTTSPPPAAPARPRVSARLLGSRTVGSATPLRMRLRCAGGPCDVRGAVVAVPFGDNSPRGISDEPLAASTTIATAGGSATLVLRPMPTYAFAQPRRAARPAIRLTVCTPDGAVAQRLTLRPLLRGRPLPPAPRIVGLRATTLRDGRVRLSWRLTRAVRDRNAYLSATISARQGWTLDEKAVWPRSRTRFALTLDPDAIEDQPAARATVVLATGVTSNAARASVRLR